MDSIQKKRIAIISIGVIFVALGISFVSFFPTFDQYADGDGWILSGIIGIVIGFLYPFPKITIGKPQLWHERASYFEDSDGGKISLAGIFMIVLGLIFGPLEFLYNVDFRGIGIIIIAVFCFGGLVLLVLGAMMVTADRFKET